MIASSPLQLPKQFIVVRGTAPSAGAVASLDIGILKHGQPSLAMSVDVRADGSKQATGHVLQTEVPGAEPSLAPFSLAAAQARQAIEQLDSNVPGFTSLGDLMPTIAPGEVVVLVSYDRLTDMKQFRHAAQTLPQPLRDVIAGWDQAVAAWRG